MSLLRLATVSKSFGGVAALQAVDFALEPGEIHGLVGENGAGKSTLMKIIAGVHHEYDGTMSLDGRIVRFRSAREALAAGIGMVHQELSVVPDLSVAENVYLGAQPARFGVIDWATMRRGAHEHLSALGIDLDPRTRLGNLPVGLQQLVEIARVLFSGARILILDEPTSALSPPETERLFTALRRLRAQGRSMVFISHFLDDVLAICDRVTVLRNGRAVATEPCAQIDKTWIIAHMIGSHGQLEESYQGERTLAATTSTPPVLRVAGLTRANLFRDISLDVRPGEVLGLYGFMGSGQLELARSLGGRPPAQAGSIEVNGQRRRIRSTAAARRAGIALVPESRRLMLFAHEPIFKNITISILDRINRLFLRPARERAIAQTHITRLRIRTPNADRALGTLSGGNQQKVGLARWLTYPPRILVLNEPTRGMDVGAKEDVLKIVHGLRDQGMAVVVASAEPETVLALADRILVMKKGEVVRHFANETVSKERLLAAA